MGDICYLAGTTVINCFILYQVWAGRMVSKRPTFQNRWLNTTKSYTWTDVSHTHTRVIYGVLVSTTSSRYGQKNMPRRICFFFFIQAVTKFKLQKKLIKKIQSFLSLIRIHECCQLADVDNDNDDEAISTLKWGFSSFISSPFFLQFKEFYQKILSKNTIIETINKQNKRNRCKIVKNSNITVWNNCFVT